MPVRKDTKERTKTVEETTYTYICAVEGCDESVEDWDPRGNEEIAKEHVTVNHNLNYIALNPFVGSTFTHSGHLAGYEPELGQEEGVYLCDDHIHKAGAFLAQSRDGGEDG